MTTKIYSFLQIFLIGFVVALSGCSEEVDDISLGSTYDRLVVEGYLSTDTSKHLVTLFRSGDALNKKPGNAISGADVRISDGTNEITLTEDSQQKGYYYTSPTAYGVPGKTYHLMIKNIDINNDGVMEEYSAVSELRKQNPIDSVKVVYDNLNPRAKGWVVNMYSQEIGGGRNFYLIKALKNGKLLTDSVFKFSFTDNTGFEGKYYPGFPVYYLSEEKVNERISVKDTITVEMCGITEAYYTFIIDFVNDYYPKVPIFSGPSANISTNILPRDKAVGFFAAYSVTRKSTVYK